MANNPFANSAEQQHSRYVQGGETDRFSNRLGWWERRVIPHDDNDYRITIARFEEGRPDLISHGAYGTAKYAWLVLQYNNIVDLNTELTAGTETLLPDEARLVLDILTRTTGGNTIF